MTSILEENNAEMPATSERAQLSKDLTADDHDITGSVSKPTSNPERAARVAELLKAIVAGEATTGAQKCVYDGCGKPARFARIGKRYTICTTHISNLPTEVNAQFIKTSISLCIGVNGSCKPNGQRASRAQLKNTGTGKKELCNACYGKLDASAKTTYVYTRQTYAQCTVCKTRQAIARSATSKKLTHCLKCKTDDMIANRICQSFGNKICDKIANYVHVDTYDAFHSARKNGQPRGHAKQPHATHCKACITEEHGDAGNDLFIRTGNLCQTPTCTSGPGGCRPGLASFGPNRKAVRCVACKLPTDVSRYPLCISCLTSYRKVGNLCKSCHHEHEFSVDMSKADGNVDRMREVCSNKVHRERVKQLFVGSYIIEHLPEFIISPEGYSASCDREQSVRGFYVDFLWFLAMQLRIFEVDEGQHLDRSCKKEIERMIQLAIDNYGVCMFRFNPDDFHHEGRKYPGLFTRRDSNVRGLTTSSKIFEKRMEALLTLLRARSAETCVRPRVVYINYTLTTEHRDMCSELGREFDIEHVFLV